MPRKVGSKTKKANPGDTNRRFTDMQREGLKAQMARLDAQGFTLAEIAVKLGISKATATNFGKEVRRAFEEEYVDNRRMWTMREFTLLMHVRSKAFEKIAELEARGRRKTVTKSGSKGGDGGAYSEETETVEDAEVQGWYGVVIDTVREVKDLLGLKDLPDQVFMQINNTVNAPDVFDQLYERLKFAADPQALADLAAAPTADEPPPEAGA